MGEGEHSAVDGHLRVLAQVLFGITGLLCTLSASVVGVVVLLASGFESSSRLEGLVVAAIVGFVAGCAAFVAVGQEPSIARRRGWQLAGVLAICGVAVIATTDGDLAYRLVLPLLALPVGAAVLLQERPDEHDRRVVPLLQLALVLVAAGILGAIAPRDDEPEPGRVIEADTFVDPRERPSLEPIEAPTIVVPEVVVPEVVVVRPGSDPAR